MNIITLRSFDNYFLASITLTKLQGAGVNCYLKDEHTVTIDPILSNAIGGIKIVVKEEDAAEAKKYYNSLMRNICNQSSVRNAVLVQLHWYQNLE